MVQNQIKQTTYLYFVRLGAWLTALGLLSSCLFNGPAPKGSADETETPPIYISGTNVRELIPRCLVEDKKDGVNHRVQCVVVRETAEGDVRVNQISPDVNLTWSDPKVLSGSPLQNTDCFITEGGLTRTCDLTLATASTTVVEFVLRAMSVTDVRVSSDVVELPFIVRSYGNVSTVPRTFKPSPKGVGPVAFSQPALSSSDIQFPLEQPEFCPVGDRLFFVKDGFIFSATVGTNQPVVTLFAGSGGPVIETGQTEFQNVSLGAAGAGQQSRLFCNPEAGPSRVHDLYSVYLDGRNPLGVPSFSHVQLVGFGPGRAVSRRRLVLSQPISNLLEAAVGPDGAVFVLGISREGNFVLLGSGASSSPDSEHLVLKAGAAFQPPNLAAAEVNPLQRHFFAPRGLFVDSTSVPYVFDYAPIDLGATQGFSQLLGFPNQQNVRIIDLSFAAVTDGRLNNPGLLRADVKLGNVKWSDRNHERQMTTTFSGATTEQGPLPLPTVPDHTFVKAIRMDDKGGLFVSTQAEVHVVNQAFASVFFLKGGLQKLILGGPRPVEPFRIPLSEKGALPRFSHIAINSAGIPFMVVNKEIRVNGFGQLGKVISAPEGRFLDIGLTCATSPEGNVSCPEISERITGLVIDSLGAMVVSVTGNGQDGILRFEGGNWLRIAGKTGLVGTSQDVADGPALDARLDSPQGLALGPNGEIYIANLGNHRIRKLLRLDDGSYVISTVTGNSFARAPDVGSAAAGNGCGYPTSVSVHPDGTIYFTALGPRSFTDFDDHSNSVYRIGGDGKTALVAGGGVPSVLEEGVSTGLYLDFTQIAVDGRHNVYGLDQARDRLVWLTPKVGDGGSTYFRLETMHSANTNRGQCGSGVLEGKAPVGQLHGALAGTLGRVCASHKTSLAVSDRCGKAENQITVYFAQSDGGQVSRPRGDTSLVEAVRPCVP